MLEKLGGFLKGSGGLAKDAHGQPTEKDLHIATGVLLLEVAGSDNDYAPEETREIFGLMQKHFKIDQDEVLNLLEVADSLRSNKSGLDDFYVALNSAFSAAQKEKIFAMVWKVIIADGRIDRYEIKMATQIRFRLQLSDEQFESAKRLAETDRI